MPKKRKGELPSGNIRRQVYIGSEPVFDEHGRPVIDEKTGKQKRKRLYKSITAETRQEADLLKAQFQTDKEVLSKPQNMTLYEAMDKYIESQDALLSPSTVSGYRVIQRTAFKGLICLNINSITNKMLREAVNAECKICHSKTKKPLSPKTVCNRYGFVSAVLKLYVPKLDTTVKLPQVVTTQHELSDPDTIFHIVQGTAIELPVMLAMWLSFTVSEILGLTKSKSISKDGRYITIEEVIVRNEHGKSVVKRQGKQPKRNRTLEIPDYIKGLIDQVETDRLVTLSGRALSARFATLVKKAGIPHMTFHDLRHVNASVMTILRVPDKYAQERGGWHSDRIMKSRYQQTFSSIRSEIDKTIDNYFDDVINNSPEERIKREKYQCWLKLFDKEDSPKNLELFAQFCADNHIVF